jgi:hypothetical protein
MAFLVTFSVVSAFKQYYLELNTHSLGKNAVLFSVLHGTLPSIAITRLKGFQSLAANISVKLVPTTFFKTLIWYLKYFLWYLEYQSAKWYLKY